MNQIEREVAKELAQEGARTLFSSIGRVYRKWRGLGKQQPPPQPEPPSEYQLPKPPEPPTGYTTLTPTDLIAIGDGHTEVRMDQLVKQHLGEWIKVVANVRAVRTFMPHLVDIPSRARFERIYVFTYDDRQVPISMFFYEDLYDMAASLNIDDRIEATGQITSIGKDSISIDFCKGAAILRLGDKKA
jgi:hypothetical protein